MSRFTGPQYKGASRDAKAVRRAEASARDAAYDSACLDDPTLRLRRIGRQLRLERGAA